MRPGVPASDALRGHLGDLFGRTGFHPPIDVYAGGGRIHVRMELAGLDPAATTISLDGRTLTIAGQRLPAAGGRVSYHHMEIPYGAFERAVELPVDVDGDGAQAAYTAGFLTVSLPVAVPATPAPTVVVVRLAR